MAYLEEITDAEDVGRVENRQIPKRKQAESLQSSAPSDSVSYCLASSDMMSKDINRQDTCRKNSIGLKPLTQQKVSLQDFGLVAGAGMVVFWGADFSLAFSAAVGVGTATAIKLLDCLALSK